MLNCFEKFVVFPSMPIESIKSICLFLNFAELGYCKTDNQGYVLLLASKVELEQVLDEIPIVREYPTVFLNDIP